MANKQRAAIFSSLILSSIFYLSFIGSPARAQILIEEGGKSVGRSVISRGDHSFRGESYSNTAQLRRDRRAGVGLGIGGDLGLAGVNIELNFTQEHSVVVGFGAGSPFQSFSAEWKYLFPGKYFSPYLSGGYARWYNSTRLESGIEDPAPGFLISKYLNPSELSYGQFALDFITPALGLQYHQLTGPYRGTSFYAEVVVLMDLRRFEPVPTGSVGAYYYF